jgi:hypothetical protein
MVVAIDLTGLPSQLRSILTDEINKMKESLENFSISIEPENETNWGGDADADISIIEEIKRRLKDVLIKNRVRDYIVISDPNCKAKIRILERNWSQNSVLYHCTHCGMEFENEVQFSIHHRIHFLI